MEYRIDDLLDEYLDQSVPMETMAYTSATTIKEMTMKKIRNENNLRRRKGHKRIFTAALAAALVFALSITAIAAYSFHQQQQEALRNRLQVDNNHISSYVEYDETKAEGVTLLSAIHDGDFQRVYVNVSPVTEEEARSGLATDTFRFSTDGGKSGGTAIIPFDEARLNEVSMVDVYNELDGTTFRTKDPEGIKKLMMDYSYDKDTQTLTLECNIWKDALSDTVNLTILRFNEADELVHTYGTVTFTPTTAEMREIRFAEPVELYNEDLQESCRVIGVRLTPLSAAWLVEIEEAQELYGGNTNLTDAQREEQISWLNCTDVLSSAALIMDNGREHNTGIILSDPYVNGLILPTSSWANTIDINAVSAVRIQNQIVSCS
ncbi:MAG: hypothetical protein IJD81_00625 [Oscillospiraceae bacterium]|nr:hypothetical protein [Oscillospiraceae bacterium]